MVKLIAAKKASAGQRHAVECLNVTGRTKKRIAQNKRACLGSLVIVSLATSAANLFYGRLVCRCHVISLCYICFVLLSQKPRNLRSIFLSLFSISMRHDGHTCSIFFFFLGIPLFPSIILLTTIFFCMKSTSHASPFRMVFFYLVTMGSIFHISLCAN